MKFYSILLVIGLLGFSSCGSKEEEVVTEETSLATDEITLTQEQEKILALQYGSATTQKMSVTIQLQGKIDLPPQNLISVNFPRGGYLKNTKLIPGMRVQKGEVIAVMEDQAIVQLQQDFLSAKAKAAMAKQEYDRQQTLFSANAGTSKSFQLAEGELKIQSVAVKSLYEKLKLIGIDPTGLNETNISGQAMVRSTINGYVSKVNVNTGKYVQATETMFELIDPDDIHAAMTIFEKDLPYIKPGNSVQIHFVDDKSKSYAAEVILVNKGVDDDRTATAHCHFKSHPSQLFPGMFIQGEVSVTDREVKALPDEAIVRLGNQEYVFVKNKNNKIVMVPIGTGLSKEGNIEVKTGLEKVAEGSIVLNHAYKLLGMLKNSEEE
jgi:cobalt-zinc-cadmium efflux system membrane fusion protein